jgi:Ca-activated chloride channel homolog
VGLEGIGDTILEALTRKGNGRYYVLDSAEAADSAFARQLAGAFRPAAENVKLQVRFNPARVGRYRLIGFDEHRLREQDFRNDAVDAAELAAEEAAVALYQVEVLPEGSGELGEVFVRFRDPATGHMVEHAWPIRYDASAPAFDRAATSMQLAGTAALMAEKMKGGPAADAIRLRDLAPVVSALRTSYANEPRVQDLVTMFGQLRRVVGE